MAEMILLQTVVSLLLIVVLVCIAVAPLLIWRNTNRANRILILMAMKQGIQADVLDRTVYGDGYIPGMKQGNHIQEAKPAGEFWKEKKKVREGRKL